MEVKSSSESSSEGKGGAGSFPSFILLRSTHFVLQLSVPVIQPLPLSCSVERSASSPDFTAFPSPLCSPAHCLHGFQSLSLLFPESFKVKFTAVYSPSLSPPPPHFPYDAPPISSSSLFLTTSNVSLLLCILQRPSLLSSCIQSSGEVFCLQVG